jgi:hypothetical protein
MGRMVATASDTISVQLCNISGSNTGVVAGTFRATVFPATAPIAPPSLELETISVADGLPDVRPVGSEAAGSASLTGQYVPIRLDLSPSSNWPTVRIRFGYSESAGAAEAAALIKYASALTDCSMGCSITITSPPDRVLYYQIERIDIRNSMSRLSAINSLVAPRSH